MFYCLECGSRKIQCLAWVTINEMPLEIVDFTEGGNDDNWCETCEEHPNLTEDRREAAQARLNARRERERFGQAGEPRAFFNDASHATT